MPVVSEFERVARLIVECHRELSATGDRLLADHGLTRARLQILGALSAGPRTLADVARETSVTRQAVQQVASGLRAEALVRSAPNPSDRRAPLHELTDLGRRRKRGRFASAVRQASGLGVAGFGRRRTVGSRGG